MALVLATGALLVIRCEGAPHARVVVTDTTDILDIVAFSPGTSELEPRSRPTLDAVAETLRGNPEIEIVEVQAHTSGIGDPDANQALSDQRAAVVLMYLIDAGVEPRRLTAKGYGDTQPIARGEPAKNERVAFVILQRFSDPTP